MRHSFFLDVSWLMEARSRWLAPLLTQTLPMASVLPIWDVLFSYSMRTRDANPKLDILVDICTSLLIRARAPLLRLVKNSFQLIIVLNISRLGKPGGKSPGLWGEEYATIRPPSPLRPWELNNAFLEGITLLQSYPIGASGGIDRVLQTAHELTQRRIEESKTSKSENITLGARIKATVWKGFTNQITDADDVEEEEERSSSDEEGSREDGNETETPDAPTLTSRLANTVWRGITNQSSMDKSPSPQSPTSPLRPPSPPPPQSPPEPIASSSSLSPPPSIWGYAEKLKDSDTIATFTKVSTNWRAKAINAWSSRHNASAPNGDVSSPASTKSELPPLTSDRWSPQSDGASNSRDGNRRSIASDAPSRPAFFRSPRESFLPLPRREPFTAPQSPEIQPQQDFIHKAQVLASLTAFNSRSATPSRPPKSAPRPLLLNSSSLITAKSPPSAHSDGGLPVKRHGEWADITKGHALHKDSMSSISSLSPSEALNGPNLRPSKSDVESDGGSRRVALNRKSISPMAPASRALRTHRAMSPLSGTSDARIHDPMSRTHIGSIVEDSSSERGWRGYYPTDSPTTVSSQPVPPTPITPVHEAGKVLVNGESRQSSISEDSIPLGPPTPSKDLLRKKTPPPVRRDTNNSDSSQAWTPRNPHVRSKRRPRLPSLRTRDNNLRPTSVVEHKIVSPNTLAPPEWLEEQEIAMTPRAVEFASTEPTSASTTSPHSPHPRRKTSSDTVRSRKISGGSDVRLGKSSFADTHGTGDSAAEEGDDEGYDDILSAYESEEGSRE